MRKASLKDTESALKEIVAAEGEMECRLLMEDDDFILKIRIGESNEALCFSIKAILFHLVAEHTDLMRDLVFACDLNRHLMCRQSAEKLVEEVEGLVGEENSYEGFREKLHASFKRIKDEYLKQEEPNDV